MSDAIRDDAGRFLPGVSGNPAGRPRVRSWTDALRRELDRPCTDEPEAVKVCAQLGIDPTKMSVGELIIRRRALLALGVEGSPMGWMQNIADIHDRVDGKAVQRSEVAIEDAAVRNALTDKSASIAKAVESMNAGSDDAGDLAGD